MDNWWKLSFNYRQIPSSVLLSGCRSATRWYSISLDLPDVPGHAVDYLGCRHTQGTGVKVAAVAKWLESLTLNEPVHDKTNKMTCAPSKDSDQPGHPPSLIRDFAVRVKKPRVQHWAHSEGSDQTGWMLWLKSLTYEPHPEKTCLRGFWPCKTQTGLLSYGD